MAMKMQEPCYHFELTKDPYLTVMGELWGDFVGDKWLQDIESAVHMYVHIYAQNNMAERQGFCFTIKFLVKNE